MIKPLLFEFFSNDIAAEPIKPAKNYIPDWYKSIKAPNYEKIKFDDHGVVDKNLKSCIPFLDSFMSGYIIELDRDLYVTSDSDGNRILKWNNQIPDSIPVSFRSDGDNKMPIPAGHSSSHFIWKIEYVMRVPKGYSLLISHPFNRFDLPFTTLTGVVDADYILGQGNLPFFIKQDFEGVIPAGTPICQILPFKRDSWKSKFAESLKEVNEKNIKQTARKFYNYYKNNKWFKKDYS